VQARSRHGSPPPRRPRCKTRRGPCFLNYPCLPNRPESAGRTITRPGAGQTCTVPERVSRARCLPTPRVAQRRGGRAALPIYETDTTLHFKIVRRLPPTQDRHRHYHQHRHRRRHQHHHCASSSLLSAYSSWRWRFPTPSSRSRSRCRFRPLPAAALVLGHDCAELWPPHRTAQGFPVAVVSHPLCLWDGGCRRWETVGDNDQ
jgi:hypothetical protein